MIPQQSILLIIKDALLMEELVNIIHDYSSSSINIVGKCYAFEEGLKAIVLLHPQIIVIDIDGCSDEEMEMLKREDLNRFILIGLSASAASLSQYKDIRWTILILKPLKIKDTLEGIGYCF